MSMTAEELRKALGINSPKLVEELHDLTQRRITYETGRQQRLDAKATSLLTASGLSVTLAFTFTRVISSQDGGRVFHRVFNYLLGAFGAALLLGFIASGFAVAALRIKKGYAVPEPAHIFDRERLETVDRLRPDKLHDETESQVDEWRLMEYRKGNIEHFWMICEMQDKTHERKAKLIKRGQLFFAGFLLSLLVVCGFVGYAVYLTHDDPQAAARSSCQAQAAP